MPIDAARRFGIPSSTIYNRLSGRYSVVGRGAETILSQDEESFLVHVIKRFQEWQQPMAPSSIKVIAKDYMDGHGRKVSQKSSLKEWFHGFMMWLQDELKLT